MRSSVRRLLPTQPYENKHLIQHGTFSSFIYPSIKEALEYKDLILQAAEKFGTPQYLLVKEMLIARTREIKQAFKNRFKQVKIFYAFKCNDLPFLIEILKDQGIHADVSCLFELKLALMLGFKHIIYTSPYKTEEEIILALNHADKVILNIDSQDEFEKIKVIASKLKKEIKISFRLTPLKENWQKFGSSLETFVKLAKEALKDSFLKWEGIHFHKSWNKDETFYVKNLKAISECLHKYFSKAELSNLRFIDVGGGYENFDHLKVSECSLDDIYNENNISVTVPYIPAQYAEELSKFVKEYIFDKLDISPEIWIEPGQLIAAQSTFILVSIDCIKDNSVIVDGGVQLLGEEMFMHKYYPVFNLTNPSDTLYKIKIDGPLCDPNDHWGYCYFGNAPRRGDVLAVRNLGAYTYSTAWRWQRPIAKYIVASNQGLAIAKEEETFEERFSTCRTSRGSLF